MFVINGLTPDEYILVANYHGEISVREPFERSFYPNTTKYSEAKPLKIKLGDHLDGFVIQIPKIEETITISGKLLYSNGAPANKEVLKFYIEEEVKNIEKNQIVSTDENGNFSFETLKGFKGKIFSEIYVTERDFENCPQLYGEVKRKLQGKDSGSLKTNEITFDTRKDISNLVIKFDFPGCQKSE